VSHSLHHTTCVLLSSLALSLCSISVNKNAIYGDTSGLNPGGIRLGTPAMTSRGLKEDDFVKGALIPPEKKLIIY